MACKLTKQDVTNQLQKDIDDKVLDTTLFVKESNTHYKYEPTFLPQVRQQIAKINDFSTIEDTGLDLKTELLNNTLDTVSLIKNADIKFNNPDLQKLINQVPSYIEMFDTINKINMEIGQDVLFPEAAGKVYTEIPESLIDQYMITADSAEHFAEMIRRDYLDQFDDARNKVNLDEFISHPHINEPVKKDLIRY